MHSDIAEGRACCRLLRELVLEAGDTGGNWTLVRQLSIVCGIANGAVADDFFKAELAVALRLMRELTGRERASERATDRPGAFTPIDEILEALDMQESRLQIIERMRPAPFSRGQRSLRPGGSTS